MLVYSLSRNSLAVAVCALALLPCICPGQATNAASPGREEWRLYDELLLREGLRWMVDFERDVKPLDGNDGKDKGFQQEQSCIRVNGRFAIPAPDESGRVVRIGRQPGGTQPFRLLFHSGSRQYQIEQDQSRNYALTAARVIGSPGGKADDKDRLVQVLTDDGGLSQAFGDGILDLRYQDGRLVAARGPIVLLTLPLESPPTNMIMEANTTIHRFQVLNLPRLNIEANPYDIPPGRLAMAGRMAWKMDAVYRGREAEDPARLTRHDDGSVELYAKDAQTDRKAEARITGNPPLVVTFNVHSASTGAGIYFPGLAPAIIKVHVVQSNGQHVVCSEPSNSQHVAQRYKQGFLVGDSFLCRVIYALDFIQVDVSADGKVWANYERTPMSGQHTVAPRRLGMMLPALGNRKENQPPPEQRIRISVDIRHFKLLDGFVDPSIINGPPSNPSGREWRMAFDYALINGWGPAGLKQKAAIDFLQAIINGNDAPSRILQTMRDLVPFARPPKWYGNSYSVDYEPLLSELSERILKDEDMEAAPLWFDAWYALDFGQMRQQRQSEQYSPPPLTREYLYALYRQQDWEALRYRSLQYLFFSRPSEQNRLAAWMLRHATRQLGDQAQEDESTQLDHWLHPLRLNIDRETANLIDEFRMAAKLGDLERACKILNRGRVDAVLTVPDDPKLSLASDVVLQSMVTSTPGLQKALVENCGPLARIRLNRAVEEGSGAEIEQIATLFPGTDAAHEALTLLADRDFSGGDFAAAIARYQNLIFQTTGEVRASLAAKFNLALAMSGQRPTEPVTTDVSWPGGRLSAEQYAQMLQSVLRDHQAGTEEPGDDAMGLLIDLAGRDKMGLRHLADLPFYLDAPIGFALAGRHLVVQQYGLLNAIDLDQQKVLWSHGESRRAAVSSAYRPLVFRNRVAAVRDENPQLLECLDLHQGRLLWQQTFSEPIVSDPVGAGTLLFVLTAAPDESLSLRRISIENGESVNIGLSLGYHRQERIASVMRMAVIGHEIVACAEGILFCCDQTGHIRWVRQLDFVPPDVDRVLMEPDSGPNLLTVDDRLIVCSPASPYVLGIDTDDGAQAWSYFQPQRRGLVGRSGNLVFVRANNAIEAVSTEDGKKAWGLPADREGAAYLPACKGGLVEIQLDRMDPDKDQGRQDLVRRARLLSAPDGRERQSWALPRESVQVCNVQYTFSRGQKVFMLSADREAAAKQQPSARLAVLE